MQGNRHQRILQIMQRAAKPVTGSQLAKRLGVSRQIVVQDMAILRASQVRILATPRGYILADRLEPSPQRVLIACRHGRQQVEEELNVLVDHGIKVVDVIVEHPLYGEIRGVLMLKSRADVRRFIRKVNNTHAELLSSITNGVHLHTLELPNASALRQARAVLRRRGILLGASSRKRSA
ncbi:MAG: transcription repressor NadR [Acidobacteriota bacterium]